MTSGEGDGEFCAAATGSRRVGWCVDLEFRAIIPDGVKSPFG